MTDIEPIKKHLFPIHIISWIFGIGIVEYPVGRPRPIFSFIYSLICITIYCAIAFSNHEEMIQMCGVTNIHLPIQILFFSQVIVTISTMILAWFRSEELNKCVMKASQADHLMGKIGLENHPKRLFKVQLLNIIPCSMLVLFMVVTSSAVVIAEDLPLSKKFLMGIMLNYPVVILFIADLTFTSIVRCATYRFEELNNFLESITSGFSNYFEYSFVKPISNLRRLNLGIIKLTQRNHADNIENIRQIHLLLNKLCQDADKMYGLQILLSIVVTFAVLIANIYMLYVVLVDVHTARDELLKTLTASFIWCTYYVVKVFKFSSVCSRCVQESIKTGDIINKLYDSTDHETQSEIREFNVQLIQSPLKFTAYGFVNLDYTLIQGMIASITTYAMILIQLGKLPLVTDLKHNYFTKILDNSTINNH